MPIMRSKWELNREALTHLLLALDPDQDSAGRKYIALRNRLVDLFAWQQCEDPEELADETLNRIARKLSENQVIQNVASYALGVARMMVHEARRAQREKMAAVRELKMTSVPQKQEPDVEEIVKR